MADITARRDVARQDGKVLPFKLNNVKIVEGALVMLNANGYIVNAADTANCQFVGFADETVDNSAGSAGDKEIKVRIGDVIQCTADFSAAQANVGDEVVAIDNQSVDIVGGATNDVYVGRIVEVLSASSVRVALAPYGGKRTDLIE